MMFTMQEPYYGILLSAMDRVKTDKVPTIGVGRSGNVFRLYYNPKFLEGKSIDTVMGLLKHEVLHVAFHHFSYWGDEEKFDSEQMHMLRNAALDFEVNSYLDRSKFDKSIKGCWPEDQGWDKYEGGKKYLQRLLMMLKEQEEQKAQAQNPQQPCNGGLGGNSQQQNPQQSLSQSQPQSQQGQQSQQQNDQQSQQTNGNPSSQGQTQPQSSGGQGGIQPNIPQEFAEKFQGFDTHEDWPDTDDENVQAALDQIIDDLMVFAAEEVEKGRGTIPGEIAGRITEIRKRKPRPVADWKRYFRRYLGNEFSEFIRKSKKRESKRFPDAAGNRHRKKSHILVAIDTSGSVSMPEYREFFGQIKTLTKDSTFHVVECDTCIQHEYEFNNRPNEVLHGGGGTSFQPPIDLFNQNRKKYDALVYFTDGGAPIPSDTPKDTLWVISSQGDHNRERYKVNGASVVIIKPKQ